jgi:hypothetical protein
MRRGLVGAAALVAALAAAGPAAAVEYRLRVVSLFESAFAAFLLKPSDLTDGAASPALEHLARSVDEGRVAKGAVLFDRHLQATHADIARAYGGAHVASTVTAGGEGKALWDEARWDGKPGEHSVWVVPAGTRWTQELSRVALKGSGPLRYFQPYSPPWDGGKLPAVAFPLNFLWFHEERGTAWDKQIARRIDLDEGIAAVVGVNTNPTFSDQVYLIVSHAEQPTTYQAVLVWRQRESDRETPRRHRVH